MAPTLKSVTSTLVQNLLELLKTPPVEVADVRKLSELVRRDPLALQHALEKDLASALVQSLQGRAAFEILRVLDFISKASARGRSEVRSALRPYRVAHVMRTRACDLECCHLAVRLMCLVARGPHAKTLKSADLDSALKCMVKFGREAPILAADVCRFIFLYVEALGSNHTAIVRALKNGGNPDRDGNECFEGEPDIEATQDQVDGLYALARHLLVEDDILTMLAITFRHVDAALKRMVRAGVLALAAIGRSRLSKHYYAVFRVSEATDTRDVRMERLVEVYNGVFTVSTISAPSTSSYDLDAFSAEFDTPAPLDGGAAVDGDKVIPSFSRPRTAGMPSIPRTVRPQTAKPQTSSLAASGRLRARQVKSAPRRRESRPRSGARKRPSRWRKKQSFDVLQRAANTMAPDKYSERDIDSLLRRLERVPKLPKRRFFAPASLDTTGLYPFEAGGCGEIIQSPSVDMDDLLAEFDALHTEEKQLVEDAPRQSRDEPQQLIPDWSMEARNRREGGEAARNPKERRRTRDEAIVGEFEGGLPFGDRLKIMIDDVHERLRVPTDPHVSDPA